MSPRRKAVSAPIVYLQERIYRLGTIMMIKFLKKRPVWRLILLLVIDALLFGNVDAAEAGTAVIITGFVMLVLTIYYILYNLLSLFGLYGFKVKHKRQAALYMTIVAGIVVALQSTGELGSRDIWVLLPLVILGYFYSSYVGKTSL